MTHVRDQKSSCLEPCGTRLKQQGDRLEPTCEGRLHTIMEAFADVTRCELCDYYAYWGVGD